MPKPVKGTHNLPNGYTLSVIDNGYGSLGQPYEVGCWETVSGDWTLDAAPFQGDVLGWQTADQVRSIIAEVALWPQV